MTTSDLVRFAAYAMLAASAWWQQREASGADRAILRVTAALSLFLGVSLVLGLAGLLAAVGRAMAVDEGLYQERRPLQAAMIAGMMLAGGIALGLLPALTRRLSLAHRVLAGLLVVLVTYVAVRAISLHQVDSLLNGETGPGLRSGDYVELLLVVLGWLSVLMPPRGSGGGVTPAQTSEAD